MSQRRGIDQPALSRLENRHNKNPTLDTLWRYTAAVGRHLVLTTEAIRDSGRRRSRRSGSPRDQRGRLPLSSAAMSLQNRKIFGENLKEPPRGRCVAPFDRAIPHPSYLSTASLTVSLPCTAGLINRLDQARTSGSRPVLTGHQGRPSSRIARGESPGSAGRGSGSSASIWRTGRGPRPGTRPSRCSSPGSSRGRSAAARRSATCRR